MEEQECPVCASVVSPGMHCVVCGEDVFGIISGKKNARELLIDEYHRCRRRATECSNEQSAIYREIIRLGRRQRELRKTWKRDERRKKRNGGAQP